MRHQTKRDKIVLNFDNAPARGIAKETHAQVYFFSTKSKVRGVYAYKGVVYSNLSGRGAKPLCSVSELPDTAEYALQNALACILICLLAKISWVPILKLNTQQDHKNKHVLTKNNIAFYDDSKATNITATLSAVSTFALSVNLLVGGVSKGQDMGELFAKLPKHVAHIFAFGPSAEDIVRIASEHGFKRITAHETMQDATGHAIKRGKGPKVVLLSPAGASFDQFKNYKDRGNKFIEYVQEWARGDALNVQVKRDDNEVK